MLRGNRNETFPRRGPLPMPGSQAFKRKRRRKRSFFRGRLIFWLRSRKCVVKLELSVHFVRFSRSCLVTRRPLQRSLTSFALVPALRLPLPSTPSSVPVPALASAFLLR
ncbi:hypothetical protein TGPRC2_204395 [Toxoplasma gondii TgCatPRC2]|uniref:Uncharacterized protein n=10 Tax=Toxoplasma gondii TaxID=5811 RepID=A0A125YH04_TOXGV|nr:hypothetical protein TGGT1_204395 [Toxoplasma gondii GT1]ESS33146.1 hypothetical protein TGVEG_204395 [Toxoplasma gondii VEG]KAF4642746.1 hypothetical protein TGRH88_034720 [Toxoplasma gondii]KFG38102.1 hypothetical protein TGDOM2_204395 [Toxoplasma gondii GAB2-2007-GAL-DOM2]KFG46425.1 hypothetical protein TGP89_204395 [Toxoplasma gondii p89]KFG61752.1 hypothetical protein TGRUB_204395 [Toxoplasma gondii RUB]KYK66376.1 hypothetical protein TGPRC2_204395 [Toxoplasma gondii TgCatPRC2]PIL995